ncbi:MAG: DUF3426 domain-containing protein [Pseudomonadota bacterium]
MSLITRCPACGTMFKVVPDQLRISEGWVRCGHCSEVFDASSNMQIEEPAPAEVASVARTEPDDRAAHPDNFESSLTTEVDDSLPSEPPDSLQLEAEKRALAETPADRPFVLMRADPAPSNEDEPEPELARRSPSTSRSSREFDSEFEPELHDLSFVRQARRLEFWRSPGMRVLLALVFLVLAAVFAAQLAVHDRDRLAAAEPALRPWLLRMCESLHCQVGPPRQIDTLAIESSSFNKLRGDAYRLNFTLKNQAATEVAMPALELTLTDGQDQPVIRRVLLPADFAPGPPVLGPVSDWSGSLALAVNANGSTSRIAGYRLLAFYP